jgi:histidine triad (HIT) family protein
MLEDFREKLKGLYIEKVKGGCVFCSLIEEGHEKIIFENEEIAVFPPLKSGALKEAHLLIVPKDHAENLFEMEMSEAQNFFGETKKFLDKIQEKSRYTGANILSANGKSAQQSIGHLHFHLVLREEEDGYDLWPKTNYSGKKFDEVNKEMRNLLD